MTPHLSLALWLDLEKSGVVVVVVAAGARLRFRPRKAMTEVLLQRVKALKQDLLVLLAVASPTDRLFQYLIEELVERIHQLWPAGYKLSNSDWGELDRMEARLVDTKRAGGFASAITAAAEYERQFQNFLQRDLPSDEDLAWIAFW